ncbi:MAG: DUF4838 domain-containing protein [Armatimonadota bacterium]
MHTFRAFLRAGLFAAVALLLWQSGAVAAPRYRDLKVYSISTAERSGAITAQTTFRNEGEEPLALKARLNPCKAIGFAGGEFAAAVAPGQSAVWVWQFTAPAGVKREILTGSISVNGAVERDLFVSVQGRDPADFNDKGAEKITEAARVVATYAPRAQASIQAEVRSQQAKRQPIAVMLAAAGKTDYSICVEILPAPPEGQEALAFWKALPNLTAQHQELLEAVAELQRCLKLQSGAELPCCAKTDGPAIRLRWVAMGRSAYGLQDAYYLKTQGKDVIIEAATMDGLRNGVYGLLTDHLDCHWFQPRGLGEEIVIPADRTVRLPAIDECKGSRWFSANGATWGYDGLWDRRNRAVVNRARMNFGHAWEGYVNKNEYPYDKFPEYYAKDRDGKIRLFDNDWSQTNFCTTNPDVLDIVAKKVNAYFAANPDAVVKSLDPNDYAPLCLCDRCLALDRQYGQEKEDGTDVADRLLHFSKEIYDRLDPKYQDKYLGILIYGYQMELPKGAKAHPHHAGLICNFPPRYDHSRPWNDPTSEKNRDFMRLVSGWGGRLKQLGYYDYYGHYYYFGPFAVIHKMREDLPAFRELGGTFLVLETQPNFGMQGLNNYIAARLEWDVDADVDLLLEEFFTKYYGPAAGPMRNFWLAAERYYALERPGTMTETRVAARPEFWTELEGHLAQAQQAIANLPAEQKRFADRVQLNRDAFDYARLMTRTYDYTRRQERLGVKTDHAADITFLQEQAPRIEALQQKYLSTDPYWPVMVREYFFINVQDDIKAHQEAMKPKAN